MVYVLSKEGKPLMPTDRHGKVRHMLDDGRAVVVKRNPFTIQLTYDTPNRVQDVTLGVDAGYKHIGMSASTQKKELYAAEVLNRDDVSKHLEARRNFRRGRRSRNKRHRKPRFDNRIKSKHKGWKAPSVENRIDTHIRAIKDVTKILPVSKIVIETAEFDIHKIKEPSVQGVGYQYGEKYGHVNTRNYILWRDGHKCCCCKCKTGKLYVVSTNGKDTVAPEDLRTLCEDCFKQYSKGEIKFKKKRHFAPPTQMGIMRDTLMLRAIETFKDKEVEQTFGYVTKGIREDYGIKKTHTNDAFCIAGNMQAKRTKDFFIAKKVRCHNRQLHKANILKGGIRKSNQAATEVRGFRLYDTVIYNGKDYIVFSRRTSGYFDIRTLDGKKVNKGSVNCEKLTLKKHNHGILVQRITA